MGMYRAGRQGIISPQKSKVCWASEDKWPRTTLLSSLSACTLMSSNSSFCQVPFPPLPPTHTHTLLCFLVYHFTLDGHIWSMSHIQSCLIHMIVNTATQGQLSIFYSQKAKPKVTERSILSKPPSSTVAQVKLDLCPSQNQVFLESKGYSWTLFGLPTKR